MLRKELVAGFVIAGFASTLVPTWFWRSLFTTGHGFWSSLENVLLGPFLALISFVCSIGNVPLAAALWRGGASFGGVIAFVFADLVTLPLLVIYRKYYGTRFMLRLLAVFWAAMSLAGLATEYLFKAAHLLPTTAHAPVRVTHAGLNYTTVLDVIAAVGFVVLYAMHRAGGRDAGSAYATDVVCGMQVRKAEAPAQLRYGRQTFFFCSDRCREKFSTNPAKFANETNRPVADHMS
jgi:YHS domain-containing protein